MLENSTSQAISDFDALCDDREFWAEVIAALKTARKETRKRVPRVPGNMKAMHERAESLETVTDALKGRKAILRQHKGQARIKFQKPLTDGNYEMVLASGVRVDGGFKVNKKGGATQDLIALQHILHLDFTGEGKQVRDEGAFLVLGREVVQESEDSPEMVVRVLYFAYPAQLEKNGTFIKCENEREVGRYELTQATAKPKQAVEAQKPVQVTPQVGKKQTPGTVVRQESETHVD